MPVNELESHPFLYNQIADFTDQNLLAKYCKLIVGTFPIYAITNSNPVEEKGLQKRANWQDEAFMQYFYGSEANYFWSFFTGAFNEDMPSISWDATDILDKYKFLITDVFSSTYRKGYSPLDNDLISPVFNASIRDIIQNSFNLQILYFTSKTAKRKFCEIMHINYINSVDNIEVICERYYRMIVLTSPAGGGRTVPHFFNDFPLSIEEVNLRENNQVYAYAYRRRYYSHYLTIPCN
jgi:hypothetical protein